MTFIHDVGEHADHYGAYIETCEELQRLLSELNATQESLFNGPRDVSRPASGLYRRYLDLVAMRSRLYWRAHKELGRAFGWTVTRTAFSYDQLVRGSSRRSPSWHAEPLQWDYRLIDHAWYARRAGRPTAVITHTYMPPQEIGPTAALMGIQATILPVSAYLPDPRCTAAVLYPGTAAPCGPATPRPGLERHRGTA